MHLNTGGAEQLSASLLPVTISVDVNNRLLHAQSRLVHQSGLELVTGGATDRNGRIRAANNALSEPRLVDTVARRDKVRNLSPAYGLFRLVEAEYLIVNEVLWLDHDEHLLNGERLLVGNDLDDDLTRA